MRGVQHTEGGGGAVCVDAYWPHTTVSDITLYIVSRSRIICDPRMSRDERLASKIDAIVRERHLPNKTEIRSPLNSPYEIRRCEHERFLRFAHSPSIADPLCLLRYN